MRVKDIVGLLVVLILALGIAVLSRMFLLDESDKDSNTQVKTIVKKADTLDILIAAEPLRVGTQLKRSGVRWQPWPETSILTGYLRKGEIEVEDLEGGVVRYPLSQGEPVTLDDIVKPGDRSFLSAIIDSGRRGISIDVNAATSSSGLIRPGDFVDVILSKSETAPDGMSNTITSEVVVSNVRVLAMDKTMGYQKGETSQIPTTPKTATLELTPSQAEVLVRATQQGQLFLSLHSLRMGGIPKACPDGICKEGSSFNHSVKVIRGNTIETITLKTVDEKATGDKL